MATLIERQRQMRKDRRRRHASHGNSSGQQGVIVDAQQQVKYRWLSVQEFTADCMKMAEILPCPIAGIAGVPRGGMYAASLLSSWLNVPLGAATPKGLVDLKVSGSRLHRQTNDAPWVILEDDTWSGRSLHAAVSALGKRKHLTAAIVAKYNAPQPDIVCRRWAGNWFCEHRFFSSWATPKSAFDFDGILCYDCPVESDDDGPKYQEFLATARRRWLPHGWTIPLIITARHEKYREETLNWLYSRGARVDKLIMGQWRSLRDRSVEKVIRHKSEAFMESRQRFFVESCPVQAKAIARRTGRIVICPPAGKIFDAGSG